jgi:hypothetical protein
MCQLAWINFAGTDLSDLLLKSQTGLALYKWNRLALFNISGIGWPDSILVAQAGLI